MPNTIIEKDFTYNIPDDYLAQTNNDNKTAEATFKGPDKIWIFVDKDTGKSTRSRLLLTDEENGSEFPTPEDQFKIEVDCATDPTICSLWDTTEWETVKNQSQLVVDLPDGTTYERPEPTDVDHTYENEQSMVTIPLKEYDKLRERQKYITDKDMIAVIDKIEELVRALRKHIVRADFE